MVIFHSYVSLPEGMFILFFVFSASIKLYCISGWWYTYPSEKHDFVSWFFQFPIYGKP